MQAVVELAPVAKEVGDAEALLSRVIAQTEDGQELRPRRRGLVELRSRGGTIHPSE